MQNLTVDVKCIGTNVAAAAMMNDVQLLLDTEEGPKARKIRKALCRF